MEIVRTQSRRRPLTLRRASRDLGSAARRASRTRPGWRRSGGGASAADDSSESRIEDADRRRHIERLQRAFEDGVRSNRCTRSRADCTAFRSGPRHASRYAKLTGQFRADTSPAARQKREATPAGADSCGLRSCETSPAFIGHPSIALSPLLRAEVERLLGPVRLSSEMVDPHTTRLPGTRGPGRIRRPGTEPVRTRTRGCTHLASCAPVHCAGGRGRSNGRGELSALSARRGGYGGGHSVVTRRSMAGALAAAAAVIAVLTDARTRAAVARIATRGS